GNPGAGRQRASTSTGHQRLVRGEPGEDRYLQASTCPANSRRIEAGPPEHEEQSRQDGSSSYLTRGQTLESTAELGRASPAVTALSPAAGRKFGQAHPGLGSPPAKNFRSNLRA